MEHWVFWGCFGLSRGILGIFVRVPGCSGFSRRCSGVFRGVPGFSHCSGCSGVFRGVPVFRCSWNYYMPLFLCGSMTASLGPRLLKMQ